MPTPPSADQIKAQSEPEDALAQRNANILMIAAAVAGYTMISSISLGGLAGQAMAPTKALATLPITGLSCGLALGILPAGMLLQRYGRKTSFLAGCLSGICGGVIATAALYAENFWLFCVGLVFAGMFGGFVQQFRFAAADTASEAFKPKAISRVLIGGIIAALVAPRIIHYTTDALYPIAYAGAFSVQPVAALLTAVLVLQLRFPQPLTQNRPEPGRPLGRVLRQPRLIIAIASGVTAYALMNFIMTAAPLAMTHHGHSESASTDVIQMHVLAMFGPSLFTGHLIARFGKEAVIACGLLLLMASSAVALMGTHFALFSLALILLGLGWNFAFIGATALVSDCHASSERPQVQMFNDACVFGSLIFASLLSGATFNMFGWNPINMALLPIVGATFAGVVWILLRPKP